MTETGSTAKIVSQQGGIFYGWWIVVAGTVIFMVSSGIGFYCHGVFLDPLSREHGWSKGSISLAVTLFFFTSGVMGVVIGQKVDKYGPKPVLITGSVLTGCALALLGRITELWQLYAVYFLMAVGWSCTAMIPVNTVITNWFIRKRGSAMSIAMTGLSVGGIIFVPLATYMIFRWGLGTALPILGVFFWVVIIPVTLFVLKQRPSDIGQYPDGDDYSVSNDGSEHPVGYAAQIREWTRLEAMKTLAFWSIVISFLLAMTGQVAYLMHQMSFLTKSIGLTGATSAVSITAGASIFGRLLLGSFIDRLEKRYAIMVLFSIQGAAILALSFSQHVIVLYLGTFAFGLTMGSILMMQSLIMGECFGLVSFATVSGAAGIFISTGAALGPAIAGFIYDNTLSYKISFMVFAAASFLAVFMIVYAKVPEAVEDGS